MNNFSPFAPALSEPDTIAAIATAIGPAGVAIVRVSGPQAFTIADRITRPKTPTATANSYSLRRTRFFHPQTSEPIDDGLTAIFCSPRSFTGEDVVEFHGHGGLIVVKHLFEACLFAGARTARPGEFSERAFAHGKMDLAQAEAVAQLVQARTSEAARAARRQMTGELSRRISECRDILLGVLARVEASIDFTEELGELDTSTLAGELEQALGLLRELLRGAEYGKRLVDGMTLVLTGQPNVGKSSLLNALAGTDRAIVTPIPGTTRDVLSETVSLAGIPVRALDTAGLRDTQDVVERIGVERARQAVETADMVVVVLDATQPALLADEVTLLQSLQGRPHVVAVNKADVASPAPLIDQVAALPSPPPCVPTVAQTGQIHALVSAIVQTITGESDQAHDPLVTSARHENALRLAQTAVEQALTTARQSLPAELAAVDVHAALSYVGEITGETTRDDVIQSIFARFCLGK